MIIGVTVFKILVVEQSKIVSEVRRWYNTPPVLQLSVNVWSKHGKVVLIVGGCIVEKPKMEPAEIHLLIRRHRS